MTAVVHLVATSRRSSTVCCAVEVVDLPSTARITITPALRTCRGPRG